VGDQVQQLCNFGLEGKGLLGHGVRTFGKASITIKGCQRTPKASRAKPSIMGDGVLFKGFGLPAETFGGVPW
jgi:hypothetical protein